MLCEEFDVLEVKKIQTVTCLCTSKPSVTSDMKTDKRKVIMMTMTRHTEKKNRDRMQIMAVFPSQTKKIFRLKFCQLNAQLIIRPWSDFAFACVMRYAVQ